MIYEFIMTILNIFFLLFHHVFFSFLFHHGVEADIGYRNSCSLKDSIIVSRGRRRLDILGL